MVLLFSPPPEFRACATKVFEADELHVTRRYKKSVLILMMSGVLRFRENGRDIELSAGEYYIQQHGLLQEGVRLGEMPVYFYVEFMGTYGDADARGLSLRGMYQKRNIMPITEQFEALFKERCANPFLLNSYMNRLFGELCRGTPLQDGQSQAARLIRHDVEAHYTETLKLSELARRFGYTTDHITRLFKEQYGMPPHRYQIGLRMEHAQWLLENTELGVEQIAYAVGYRDFSAFYRAYRKAYGYSPGEVRKKMIFSNGSGEKT